LPELRHLAEVFMSVLGYMTAREAKAHGFTHHGKYFGIPVWIGNPDSTDGGMLVATKWAPMEYLMTAAHVVEGVLRSTFYPQDEPTFQFLVGDRIKEPCRNALMAEFRCKDRDQCWEPCGELGHDSEHARAQRRS
jgi:hypothetical protein